MNQGDQAARRASLHPNTSPRTLEASSSCSSTFEEERQFSSPVRRRHGLGNIMVYNEYKQLEGEDEDENEVKVDRALISPTEFILHATGILDDGVVDVSDHKTCALLMTRMKEANRQPSPSHDREQSEEVAESHNGGVEGAFRRDGINYGWRCSRDAFVQLNIVHAPASSATCSLDPYFIVRWPTSLCLSLLVFRRKYAHPCLTWHRRRSERPSLRTSGHPEIVSKIYNLQQNSMNSLTTVLKQMWFSLKEELKMLEESPSF
ncbi:hypothetical protein NECAME_02801 [Necator americanus]|uniref:Uncharacterized protein n=1 Tax=Necator americanus TaxID=51031 RepID=W2TAN5_NECAM|nr:hypothetical protein NECAME_02801 [Necator americanus]ETN78654.1 hypothetical protein NECAME_02801 [Necator americanus]